MEVKSILLLSTAETASFLSESSLELEFDMYYAETVGACFVAAECEEIDMILFDVELKARQHIKILDELRAHHATRELPVMLYCGDGDLCDDADEYPSVVGKMVKGVHPRTMASLIKLLALQ